MEYSRSCVIALLEFLRSLKPQLVPHTENNASVIQKSHNKLNGHVNSLLFFSDLHQNQQVSTIFNTNYVRNFTSVRQMGVHANRRKERRKIRWKDRRDKVNSCFWQLL